MGVRGSAWLLDVVEGGCRQQGDFVKHGDLVAFSCWQHGDAVEQGDLAAEGRIDDR